ncbi:hypothetical protein AV530_015273 [Patagioenas fasciata monilis]|uniref:Uncharacterized protein n=1 Tax=Patagioenas fasciata monilis TaxID=372326 RepID=A0A1V4K376_PATFA|nr:hypothetical protein AV530_015273 [Patagioenas fasciata monilis]
MPTRQATLLVQTGNHPGFSTSVQETDLICINICPILVQGSLSCEAPMTEAAKLLLSWVCALQLEALALHITLINRSRADLPYAPQKMHQ